jgi:hypothetical protein
MPYGWKSELNSSIWWSAPTSDFIICIGLWATWKIPFWPYVNQASLCTNMAENFNCSATVDKSHKTSNFKKICQTAYGLILHHRQIWPPHNASPPSFLSWERKPKTLIRHVCGNYVYFINDVDLKNSDVCFTVLQQYGPLTNSVFAPL